MSEKHPAISIDFKTRKRIRIHKATLQLLGDPKYIQILINPKSNAIAIRSGDPTDPLSLRVRRGLSDDGCHEVCSLDLTNSLMHMYKNWEDGKSYRINGEMAGNENIALFFIRNMTEIKENR
ncbi:MAG: hypothetical protein IJK53_07385 [Erysipelotrichaceae bacterium]|nr:hypothetical protein [Clostridia bacterium]MBQ6217192.1 hypothetical protein [Erysipelotrichaceae bacterium]